MTTGFTAGARPPNLCAWVPGSRHEALLGFLLLFLRTAGAIVCRRALGDASPNRRQAGARVAGAAGGKRLSEAERIDWLRLIRTEQIGPRGIMAQAPQEI